MTASPENWRRVLEILTVGRRLGEHLTRWRRVGIGRSWTSSESQVFPATVEHVRETRRFVAKVLQGRDSADEAVLCLSELVANSLMHSRSREPGGTLTVHVHLAAKWIRVEVDDQGGRWRKIRPHDDEHGRGLSIVTELSAGWKTEETATGRKVWFEMVCPVRESAGVPSQA